jgi:hypothetical protein
VEAERIIRPAAVLPEREAFALAAELARQDVSRGGLWNASGSVWQRYDRPWNGLGGMHGDARLVGSLAVTYDQPQRHEITIYKVTIAPDAVGWTVDRLCDDALSWVGLTLATCPRAALRPPPAADPFRSRGFDRVPAPRRALDSAVGSDMQGLPRR